MRQTAPELAHDPHTMIDDVPVPRASSLLLGGWLLGLLAAIGGAGTFGLFLGAFSKPHAFGGRDGQGAAGIAALLLLVGLGVAVIGLVIATALGLRLRASGKPWAPKLSLALPLATGLLAFLFALLA